MIQELKELQWLIIPLYPVIVVILFGVWLFVRARGSRRVDVKLSGLGVTLDLKLDDGNSVCEPHQKGGQP